jgi:hypothetical protein
MFGTRPIFLDGEGMAMYWSTQLFKTCRNEKHRDREFKEVDAPFILVPYGTKKNDGNCQ